MMMRRLTLLVISLSLCLVPLVGAAETEPVYIRCQIFRVMGNMSAETSLENGVWASEEPPGVESKQALTLFTGGRFQLDDDLLESNDKGWFWNGTPLTFDAATKVSLPADQIRLISAPTFLAQVGQPVTVSVSSTQKIEYFERRDDGLFELKRLKEPTALNIELRLEEGGSDREKRAYLANVTFSLRSVEKREPIPDLTLPVGRPVLQTREFSAAISVVSGRDYGFVLNPGAGQGVLIVRLRAEPPPDSLDHETDRNE